MSSHPPLPPPPQKSRVSTYANINSCPLVFKVKFFCWSHYHCHHEVANGQLIIISAFSLVDPVNGHFFDLSPLLLLRVFFSGKKFGNRFDIIRIFNFINLASTAMNCSRLPSLGNLVEPSMVQPTKPPRPVSFEAAR